MATVNNKMVFEVDPRQPVQEICSIASHFLQLWPGSEDLILEGVKKEIDKTLFNIKEAKKKSQPAARPTNNRRHKKRR